MPLYKEQTTTETIETKTYVRSYKVEIENPLGGLPSIVYQEEKVLRRDDGDFSQGRISDIKETLSDSNQEEVFDLIDPESGEVVGQGTYNQLRVLVYSLYFHLATKRDNS